MNKYKFTFFLLLLAIAFISMNHKENSSPYADLYSRRLAEFQLEQKILIASIEDQKDLSPSTLLFLNKKIEDARLKLKAIDFWLRYLDPVAYKKINGPLPVEWETEVFEKFEKPYKRYGAGLTLAQLYLSESDPEKGELLRLLRESDEALKPFWADSLTSTLAKPSNFFFANRLFLLNLSAIYTTGFECPESDAVIEELQSMLKSVKDIYQHFIKSFPSYTLTGNYLQLYDKMQVFVASQNKDVRHFDHFRFIRDYVNPLFAINQELIKNYRVFPRNYNDFSLNNDSHSIFDKDLYTGQNGKGIFIAVHDQEKLDEIKAIGKMLFFDPILSGNGKRSCASCHKPGEYFTDTSLATGLTFNKNGSLPRNTPSLLNVVYNHLLMQDGKHISLQDQAKDVISNPVEMGCNEKNILDNVLSCDMYKKAFLGFKKLTPYYDEITIDHIVSAITLYYSDFSKFYAPFDRAMNRKGMISTEAIDGFNLFMSKAQCATCHFVPQFNGVKPPYTGSEFEVIGVPADTAFRKLSSDPGRYGIHPAEETLHAFRTGSIRNSSYTRPYMHNGVFNTMDEVIDFYDAGGGAGKGLKLDNQTLSSDSLRLTPKEKKALKAFIKTLDEDIIMEKAPATLPATKLSQYKARKVGGEY